MKLGGAEDRPGDEILAHDRLGGDLALVVGVTDVFNADDGDVDDVADAGFAGHRQKAARAKYVGGPIAARMGGIRRGVHDRVGIFDRRDVVSVTVGIDSADRDPERP